MKRNKLGIPILYNIDGVPILYNEHNIDGHVIIKNVYNHNRKRISYIRAFKSTNPFIDFQYMGLYLHKIYANE